jgi:hypothetical protein
VFLEEGFVAFSEHKIYGGFGVKAVEFFGECGG